MFSCIGGYIILVCTPGITSANTNGDWIAVVIIANARFRVLDVRTAFDALLLILQNQIRRRLWNRQLPFLNRSFIIEHVSRSFPPRAVLFPRESATIFDERCCVHVAPKS